MIMMIETSNNQSFSEIIIIENKLPALPPNPSPSQSSIITVTTNSSSGSSQETSTLYDEIEIEKTEESKDSTAFILAQIERQNVLLEKDPKSIYIQSNQLKAHFSTMQQLVKDNIIDDEEEDVDWGFWESVIQDSDQVASRLPHLLSLKLRSGIPSRARGLMWQAMSKSASLHLETVYDQLCKEKSPHERIIQRDLARTFPHIDMFKQENGHGQSSMRRILEAYSLYDTDVGYCQGLAFLVGPLLLNMPETQSFCVFVRLMETYEMRSMFTLNMEGLQLRLYQFNCLLKEILPDLAKHLDEYGIHAAMYASQWFLTLFAYVFPMELINRIYDIVFAEGATETIMRVAIGMLKRSESTILYETNTEFEDILDFLTSRKLCEPYVNSLNNVIHDAMALSDVITRNKLESLNEEYNLKSANGEDLPASNRFSFWRKRKTHSNDIKRSTSIGSAANINKSPQITTSHHKPPALKKRWSSVSSRRDWSYKSSPIKESNLCEEKTLKQVLKEFEELKKVHEQTLGELAEIQCDKQDLECERGALKLTIAELERCITEKTDDCDILTSASSLMSDLSVAQNKECMYSQDSQQNDASLSSSTPTSVIELEQKCSELSQNLEKVKAKYDMINEGQIQLVDKFVTMKADMEEVMNEKKEKEDENLHLKLQNEKLQAELNKLKTMFADSLISSDYHHTTLDNVARMRRHSISALPCVTDKLNPIKLKLSENDIKNSDSGKKKKTTSSIYGRVLNAFGKSTDQ